MSFFVAFLLNFIVFLGVGGWVGRGGDDLIWPLKYDCNEVLNKENSKIKNKFVQNLQN